MSCFYNNMQEKGTFEFDKYPQISEVLNNFALYVIVPTIDQLYTAIYYYAYVFEVDIQT